MSALSEEVSKLRTELRVAEQSRDALKRELAGEDPVLLPEVGSGRRARRRATSTSGSPTRPSCSTNSCAATPKSIPDVAATRRLIASLEQQKKQELEARRKAAAANPARFSGSTNPVFQQLKISLADAEANVAALRARLERGRGTPGAAEVDGRPLAPGRGRDDAVDARLRRACARTTSNWSRGANRPRSRRTSTASRAWRSSASSSRRAFRRRRCFPIGSRWCRWFLRLRSRPARRWRLRCRRSFRSFYDARQVRAATKRAVLGTVSMQPTQPIIHQRRKGELRVRRRRGEPGHAVRQLDRLGRAGRARLRSRT